MGLTLKSCKWGKVNIKAMKNPAVLQALASLQAYSKDLRLYVQIG